jgi:hypothetical protein
MVDSNAAWIVFALWGLHRGEQTTEFEGAASEPGCEQDTNGHRIGYVEEIKRSMRV